MKQPELLSLKKWFTAYCASFAGTDAEEQKNYTVKEMHTHEVCRNIVRIGRDLMLSDSDLLLAEAIALFHDTGRFPQYERYKTFDDAVSVNHAALSAQVLLEQNTLAMLGTADRALIIHAVTLHNAFSLPPGLDERTLLFVRMVRDADKLDILRVALEYYGQSEEDRAEAVGLGLPDTPGYSERVLECLTRGAMARKADLTTLNDFKLLQLSWLYDLNFPCSFGMVSERRYVDKLAALLPDVDPIQEAVAVVRAYVNAKAPSAVRRPQGAK